MPRPGPKIEVAEVLSFRLKVPKDELSRWAEAVKEPALTILSQDNGLRLELAAADGESVLKFNSIGDEAMLHEIFIANDERGLFFQRVLGPLMVRYGGDLVIRLTWNTSERNSHGDFAEVKVQRGVTTYPGLANLALPSPAGLDAGAAGSSAPDAPPTESDGEPVDEPLSPDEEEVVSLLQRAKIHWDDYQKLKAKK